MNEFSLPDVGEGLTEAEIVGWRVAVGDEIAQDQVIVEIETAKSIVELPSPFSGTVVQLMASEGDVVRVGSALVGINTGEPDSESSATAVHDETQVGEPVLVGYGTKAGPGRTKRIRRPAGPSAGRQSVSDPAATETGRLLAKPPVRLLAKQHGLDLSDVPRAAGSSFVTRDDVVRASGQSAMAASRGGADSPATPTPLLERSTDEDIHRPVRGVLKATAEAVTRSAFTAPHASLSLSVDLTRALRVVKELRGDAAWSASRPSILLLVAKAFLLAIAENPDINASWGEADQLVHIRKSVNLGIAAATPRGLVVPNIKDAQALALGRLAVAMTHLISEARAGTTKPTDMSGGTITITNIGSLGIDFGAPILNLGEAAILAVGASTKRAWVVGKRIKIRDVATFTLTFDHRVVNGDLGARVLTAMARILTRPEELWRYV